MKDFRRVRVVFVCIGNSCRSPMAEGIAAHIASDVMEVSSAGVAALGRVQSMTKTTLTKNGYPTEGLESKPCEDVDLGSADIIVNMTGQPGQAVFQDTSRVEDWYVEDPYGSDAATYQRIFEDIERRVVELVGRARMSAVGEFKPRSPSEKGSGRGIEGRGASEGGQG